MCVLVVEDDTLIRTILMEELFEAGLQAEEARSGEEAGAMLGRLADTLCVLVTDIHMPGTTDGIALAERVRAERPGIPVIFTTGRPDALLRLGALGDGQWLVRKPYVPAEVIERILAVDPALRREAGASTGV